MSFLEKLLDSKEVAYLPLGEVGTFARGNSGLQKKDFTESGIGCIHYGQIYTYYGTFADETKSFVSESLFEKSRKAKKGNLIIADTSENDEDLCKAVAWLGEDGIAVSNHTFIYTHSLNPKYVSYFLQTNMFHKQKRPFITGTKVRSISAVNMAKIQIPIPCPDNPGKSLEIQNDIVNILDKFDPLTTALTTEIELRQKQYNYYRDKLLSFEEDAELEWFDLGFITNYEQPSKYLVKSTNYDDVFETPVLTAGKTFILGYTDETKGIYEASKHPVIIFDDFTTANKWVDFDFKAKSSAMKMITSSDDNKFILKYIYYWLNKLPGNLTNGDHKRQWISSYCNRKIPIPYPDNPEKSLEEQKRIVTILDKFDTLTNSISEGLPRVVSCVKNKSTVIVTSY